MSEVQVLTFGGNLNGEIVFSVHTLTLRIGDKGIFFISKQHRSEDLVEYYQVYAEKQGYYREKFNGRTKELISQFSKFKGRNTFYKELGQKYSEEGFQMESEKDNCLQFRIEPRNIASIENSSILQFNLYVKSIDGENPIYIENTQYDSEYYDSQGLLQKTICGEINVESQDVNLILQVLI